MRLRNGMMVRANGDRVWYKDGNVHREDGPAYISAEGECRWYLNDKFVTELRHFELSPYYQNLPDSERLMRRLQIS